MVACRYMCDTEARLQPPVLPSFEIAALTVYLSVLILAAISDARRLEIPNWISLVLAASFLPAAVLAGLSPSAIAIQYVLALATFVVAAILFSVGLLGGGDVKFVSATVIWIHWQQIGFYFFCMAVLGGVIAAVVLVLGKVQALAFLKTRIPWMNDNRYPPHSIPYGVAIASAALVVVVQSNFSLFGRFIIGAH